VYGGRAEHGVQERRLADTTLFVLPSTSPANAAVPWEERLRWFRALKDLVE
jgi:G:T/U-mismatch repair DNA glycosylase